MSRRRIRPKSRPRMTVRHASDLLAVIPYLVGFHPSESIVAVLMRSGKVALTMRVDLPTTSSVAEAGAALARQLTAVARTHRLTRMVLVGYSADQLRANRVLTATMDEIPRSGRPGLELADVYYVDGERWWSLTCNGPCCPLEGTPYDLGSHPYAAEAVYAGIASSRAAHPSRRVCSARIRPTRTDWRRPWPPYSTTWSSSTIRTSPVRRFSRPSARRSTGPRSATRSVPGWPCWL